MYQGEVSIDKWERNNFLAVARDLEVNDLTEETFKDSKQSIEDKSKKQRLDNSPKQQFNLDYKIKTDIKLDDSHLVVNDLKTIDKLEDFEQFADEDFVNFDDKSESISLKIDGRAGQDKIEITVAHDLKVEDVKDSKQSIKDIDDKNKKQRLDGSTKQQFKLDHRIKTDNIFHDCDTVVNDLKNDELEDFEQFGDEDFVDFDDESKSIIVKKNPMDTSPTQDVNVDYKIKIEMENKNYEKNENIISIQDTGKGQRNSCVQKLQIRDIAKLSGNEDQSISSECSASKTRVECEQCNKTYSCTDSLKSHILSAHEGVRYPCPHCDYKATSKGDVKKHVLSIHKGMQYPCSLCDYKTITEADMKKHVLSIHEGKQYQCSHCDYKATRTTHLKTHVLSMHKGIRYPCSQCDYKATTTGHLKSHVLSTHKGIRHPCSHCDYKATTTTSLKKHVLSIHEGMRYPCSQCDYKATTTSYLKTHVMQQAVYRYTSAYTTKCVYRYTDFEF